VDKLHAKQMRKDGKVSMNKTSRSNFKSLGGSVKNGKSQFMSVQEDLKEISNMLSIRQQQHNQPLNRLSMEQPSTASYASLHIKVNDSESLDGGPSIMS
jgi:hypothetical protein